MGKFIIFALYQVQALDNGLGLTPPMGWMSWQRYGCEVDCTENPAFCLSEELVHRTADALVSSGLRDAGFTYVHIDDCWLERQLDKDGRFVPDKIRFPSGMHALSQYVHARGLKLGIYSDIGSKTCAGFPGIGGNFRLHAETLAAWEIDAIKVDGCYMEPDKMSEAYRQFGQALNQTDRPILYSCSWPAYAEDHCENEKDLATLKHTCNLWRNFNDIEDSWKSVMEIVSFFARPRNDLLVEIAGPGGFNDPDMLLLGNPGLSLSEQQCQYAVWAVLAAPLYLSTDVGQLAVDQDTLSLLLNPEIIAVSQDVLGKQGYVVSKDPNFLVFARPLVDGNFALVFVNFANAFGPRSFRFDPRWIDWPEHADVLARDLLARADVVGNFRTLSFPVDESSCRFFKVTQMAGSGSSYTTDE